ncbi:TPA: DapH/DapD/GlmU-related protein [Streptococcus suis]
MVLSLKKLIKKLVLRHKFDSDSYIKYLRNKGISIGEGTVIFNPQRTWIDETRPWMIEIGNDVQIPDGVTILTHGYDWSVLKGLYGNVLGSAGKVNIGNNVFIGMNSTILKGVTIGDNVIIGANSLVTKNIPSNTVVAGNPTRVISDIDTYLKKRLDSQLEEARELVISYYNKYQEVPDKSLLYEFFWLFTNVEDSFDPEWDRAMRLVRNYSVSMSAFKNNKQIFNSYEEFIKFCLKDIDFTD